MAAIIFEQRPNASSYNPVLARRTGLEMVGRSLADTSTGLPSLNPIDSQQKLFNATEIVKTIMHEYAINYNTTGGNWLKRILYGENSAPSDVERIYKVERNGTQVKCWLIGNDTPDPAKPGAPGLILDFRRDNDVGKKMNIAIPEKFPDYNTGDNYLYKAADDLLNIGNIEQDAYYLISTLTFRRCL